MFACFISITSLNVVADALCLLVLSPSHLSMLLLMLCVCLFYLHHNSLVCFCCSVSLLVYISTRILKFVLMLCFYLNFNYLVHFVMLFVWLLLSPPELSIISKDVLSVVSMSNSLVSSIVAVTPDLRLDRAIWRHELAEGRECPDLFL